MESDTRLRRAVCADCRRAQSACICRWIAPTVPLPDVLIVQHPGEVGEAKGSARLLHLSLAGSRLVVGETFPEADLRALLHDPLPSPGGAANSPPSVRPATMLLYPPVDFPGMATAVAANMAGLCSTDHLRQVRLVVLDATWRKSLKMLARNPLLQTLPRLALDQTPPSAYCIRRARHPHQLSTLEATCHALAALERDAHKYQRLLGAFEGFVSQQLAFQSAAMR